MRILMISDVYFPRITGVSTSIQTCAREFIRAGHEVTLIAPDYGHSAAEPFEILRIPSRYLPIDPEDRMLRPRQLRRHETDLAQRGFDVVHIHTPFLAHYSGLRLARVLDVPVVETYHTYFEQYLQHYVSFMPAVALRWVARHFAVSQCQAVNALIVPSQPMREVLLNYGVQTQMVVIPTGIALEQFRRGDGGQFRARYQIPPDRPLLVHVSRLAFEKNIAFILRALVRIKQQVPDVLLALVGAGPAQAQLAAQIQALGLTENTLLTGYLERDGSLENCYSAATAFVFASRTETQGLVVLEALALGVPVVSTAVLGTKEVLAAGRGAVIAEDDEADFAAKVVRVVTDAALRERLAQEAVEYAQTWSAPVLADRLLRLYAEARHRP
jgi:1,2-diacylglycerol 3-alpha-glucosyltransferase